MGWPDPTHAYDPNHDDIFMTSTCTVDTPCLRPVSYSVFTWWLYLIEFCVVCTCFSSIVFIYIIFNLIIKSTLFYCLFCQYILQVQLYKGSAKCNHLSSFLKSTWGMRLRSCYLRLFFIFLVIFIFFFWLDFKILIWYDIIIASI